MIETRNRAKRLASATAETRAGLEEDSNAEASHISDPDDSNADRAANGDGLGPNDSNADRAANGDGLGSDDSNAGDGLGSDDSNAGVETQVVPPGGPGDGGGEDSDADPEDLQDGPSGPGDSEGSSVVAPGGPRGGEGGDGHVPPREPRNPRDEGVSSPEVQGQATDGDTSASTVHAFVESVRDSAKKAGVEITPDEEENLKAATDPRDVSAVLVAMMERSSKKRGADEMDNPDEIVTYRAKLKRMNELEKNLADDFRKNLAEAQQGANAARLALITSIYQSGAVEIPKNMTDLPTGKFPDLKSVTNVTTDKAWKNFYSYVKSLESDKTALLAARERLERMQFTISSVDATKETLLIHLTDRIQKCLN